MDAVRWRRVRALFEAAVELPLDARAAFLARECAEADVRAEVAGMLAAETGNTAFLRHPSDGAAGAGRPAASAPPAAALPDPAGKRVGDYELVRLIATGGMGSVYEAVQEQPRRRVALKMLRPGLAGEEYLARFRREVEVLALLSHPGIAQIHAAGVHEEAGATGLLALPWFAMEYVAGGLGLLEHARAHRLGRRARVDLFLAVCAAVQHGHQRGVIHRDLKPSNVLVGEGGRPKVIDFGIALATRDEDGGSSTRRTQAGQVLGTVRYMSPEQLSGAPDLVDTRTDVYALGVILYELLCDRPPFDLDGLPLTEMARVIREAPPRPPSAARPDLPRELGWIALRCLAKEPARRYSTVAELAADLGRFLAHEPVAAGPPTAVYRVRKFVRRNRGAVAAAAVIAVLLLAGLVGTSLGLAERGRLLAVSEARRQEAEREAAKLAAVNSYVSDMLESANPWRVGARDVRMADVLDGTTAAIGERFAGRPAVEGALRATLGTSYLGLGLHEQAEVQLRRALELMDGAVAPDDPGRLAVLRELIHILAGQSRVDEAERLAAEAVELASAAGDALELARGRKALAQVFLSAGRYGAAEEELTRARDELVALYAQRLAALGLPPDAPAPAELTGVVSTGYTVEAVLASVLLEQQRFAEVEELARESLARLGGGGDLAAEIPLALHRSSALVRLGRLDEAAPLVEALRAEAERIFGPDHPEAAKVLVRLAALKELQGDLAGAEELNRRLLAIYSDVIGPDSATALRVRFNLSIVLDRQGRVRESDDELMATIEGQTRSLGRGHPDSLRSLSYLALKATSRGQWEEVGPRIEDFLAAASLTTAPDDGADIGPVLEGFRSVLSNLVLRNRLDPACTYLGDLLAIQRRALGERARGALRTEVLLARALYRNGRAEEAKQLLQELLPAQREQLAPDDPDLLAAQAELSTILLELGEWEPAEAATRAALEHADRTPGTPEAGALNLAHNLAWLLLRRDAVDEARRLLEDELAAAADPSRPASRPAAKMHELLGGVLAEGGDPAAAEPHLAAAVELWARHHGGEHADVARARKNHEACLTQLDP